VLIPVGAALIARDRLLAGVSELPRDPSVANAKAQAQLRKFERRGTSARNSLEREARRTRVRLERELRRRRGELDRAVNDLDKRRNSISRNLTEQVEGASTQIERTVQARVKDATSLAGKVQDRVLDLV
jgi:DNA anti-recombination protein RmuC